MVNDSIRHRDNLQIKPFKLESWSPGAGFFSIVAIAIINLSLRIRDSDFKNNFVIMKREINTF